MLCFINQDGTAPLRAEKSLKQYHLLLFSRSVVTDSLWPHGLQHARLPCPSLSPGVCSNSCPLSWWCHPAISPSVAPFSYCPQSFPALGSFAVSQLFASGGQCIRASASASDLPINIQGWFSLWLTGLLSLQSKGLSRVFSNNTVRKHWMKVKWWGLRKHCWLIALCQVCSHIVSLSPNNKFMK